MSAVEGYLTELGSALHVRGRARRRFLRECRDHLADAAAERGEADAVRVFGPPEEIAAAFDAEVAARRGVRATFATVAGVLAMGGSTLALIHSSEAGATGPTVWAVAFFVAAQLAGVAAALALLQALVTRRAALSPADAALLARRNGCALLAAGLTMFAAGAALPGHGSAGLLLAGPVLVCGALVAVLRARRLAWRLEGAREAAIRPPLNDLRALVRLPVPLLNAGSLLLVTTCVAAAAAFIRDLAEHATVGGAVVTACIEAMAVVGCFVVLGRPLGLWCPRAGHARRTAAR
ncbi:MAG: HAAS signaling domain-containing protein [Longimicrobiaceae bacterium]